MRILRWGYLLGLHVVLVALLWKTDAVELAERRLGWWVPPEMGRNWHDLVAFHRRIDAQLPEGAVLFIGDSLFQGFDVSRFGRPAANFGIGGDTTLGVLARLDSYRSIATASAVVVLIGLNDLKYRPPEDIVRHQAMILARLQAAKKLVAVGLLPVDERGNGKGRNELLQRLNIQFRGTCAAYANCHYVDAWSALASGDGLSPAYHEGDGRHLNSAGYTRLAALLAETVQP